MSQPVPRQHHSTSEAWPVSLPNPFDGQLRFVSLMSAGLALVAAVCGAIAWFMGGFARPPTPLVSTIFLLLAVLIGIIAVVFLCAIPLVWSQGALAASELRAMKQGDFLARWKYAPDVWIPWIKGQCARLISTLGMALAVIAVSIPLTIAAMFIYARSNGLNASAQWAQTIVLIPLLVGLAVVGVAWALALKNRTRLTSDPPFVCCISKSAVYMHGKIYPYESRYGQLAGVKLMAGKPTTIEFMFRVAVRTGWRYRAVPVLVPAGSEHLAEQVVAALKDGR